jgi:hypothetical protein
MLHSELLFPCREGLCIRHLPAGATCNMRNMSD